MLRPDDTIVAPATPYGRGALAIVRLDGPEAIAIVGALSREPEFADRYATHTRLYDGDELLDDVVVIAYQGPRSFTGNDLVEVSLHGSPLLVDRFLRAAVVRGARLAEPGEFTERAVLNGKIDLVQAEAIADLIASRTGLQARVSLTNLRGAVSRWAVEVREAILFVISRLEAALDFADEGHEFITKAEATETIAEARKRVAAMGATYERGSSTIRGLTAVILGRPNAGKSTLLNALCGSDRAIVTAIPGTTRDLLRESVVIGGLPVTVVDTAGMRVSTDEVERIGIERARDEASRAEIVIYLVDAESGLTEEDEIEIGRIEDAMVVFSKIDRSPAPPGFPGISVPAGLGVDELLTLLDGVVRERFAAPEGSASLVTERQLVAVKECETALGDAERLLLMGMSEEIIAVDLRKAANAIGRLTGEISQDEVLHEIFSKFCIGK